MRKTSTYARKLKKTGGNYVANAFVATLQRCRSYTAPPMPGIAVEPMITAATASMLRVREAYTSIKQRETPPSDGRDFDMLTHAMAVSVIRAIQIAGADADSNAMLQIIAPANAALRRMLDRRNSTGVWGFDGPAIEEVAAAMDVYDEILMASTPAQMLSATNIHSAREFGCVTETVEEMDAS